MIQQKAFKLSVEESNFLDRITARCKMNVAVNYEGTAIYDYDIGEEISLQEILDACENDMAAAPEMFTPKEVSMLQDMCDKYMEDK